VGRYFSPTAKIIKIFSLLAPLLRRSFTGWSYVLVRIILQKIIKVKEKNQAGLRANLPKKVLDIL